LPSAEQARAFLFFFPLFRANNITAFFAGFLLFLSFFFSFFFQVSRRAAAGHCFLCRCSFFLSFFLSIVLWICEIWVVLEAVGLTWPCWGFLQSGRELAHSSFMILNSSSFGFASSRSCQKRN
jgi:hypothetical protein